MNEQQKIEELLKPRILVTDKWPGMECEVGDVINLPSARWKYNKDEYCNTEYFAAWPNLFRLLAWWEKREASEMPEYLKFTRRYHKAKAGDVAKVSNYSKDLSAGNLFDSGWFNLHNSGILPATISDYNNFLNQQKEK